jgi:hypothetical protein
MNIKEVRLLSAKVEFQAKSDPAFLKRLQDDPVAVLQAEGFDYPTAQEIATQLRTDSAVPAEMCPECDTVTCWVTACCWYTLEPPVKTA